MTNTTNRPAFSTTTVRLPDGTIGTVRTSDMSRPGQSVRVAHLDQTFGRDGGYWWASQLTPATQAEDAAYQARRK